MYFKAVLCILIAIADIASSYRPLSGPIAYRKLHTHNKVLQSANKIPHSTRLSATPNVVAASVTACSTCGLFATAKRPVIFVLLGAFIVFAYKWFQRVIWTPSRTYDAGKNTVGTEYDAWTSEGILEYYWGEHIHLGYYSEKERLAGYKKKDFVGAKYDFIDRMMEFGKIDKLGVSGSPLAVLDVGCGIGGTSRYLAKKLGAGSSVTGITVSEVEDLLLARADSYSTLYTSYLQTKSNAQQSWLKREAFLTQSSK
jgi:MPBQ/MSBQ methyltransferase